MRETVDFEAQAERAIWDFDRLQASHGLQSHFLAGYSTLYG
jgi:hypothetical protein